MRHVLITGGAGFLGSHLCDAFLARGYAVTAVDNLLTGNKANLARALASAHFDFVEANVSKPLLHSLLRLLRQHGLSGVLHFACPACPVDFARLPFEILEVGSLGTMHTVSLALRHKARYLLASGSEFYGDPLEHPQAESYRGNVSPTGPRACYDEAKRFSEVFVTTSARNRGLHAGIARIFDTYGPRMRPGGGCLVPEFATQAIAGADITVCGDGRQTRSLCFVSDLVEGVVRLFESETEGAVNLGNPDERSVLEIARLVRDAALSPSQIRHLPARTEDPHRRCPDIRKAKAELAWQPRVPLAQGMQATLSYFRALAEHEPSPGDSFMFTNR